MLISSDAKKMWSGVRTCKVPIPLKIISLSLSAILANCRSQVISGLGREKLKTMLFYMMWIPSTFNCFDTHSSVHCSSRRLIIIHSFRLFFQKLHYILMEGIKGPWYLAGPRALENHEPALHRRCQICRSISCSLVPASSTLDTRSRCHLNGRGLF